MALMLLLFTHDSSNSNLRGFLDLYYILHFLNFICHTLRRLFPFHKMQKVAALFCPIHNMKQVIVIIVK